MAPLSSSSLHVIEHPGWISANLGDSQTASWGPLQACHPLIQVASYTQLWRVSTTGLLGTLQWRHNGCDDVLNHQPHDCLLNYLFRCRSKKTSKLRVTGLFEGNSPTTGEFPAQRPSYEENVSTLWHHHEEKSCKDTDTKHDSYNSSQ